MAGIDFRNILAVSCINNPCGCA